MTNEKGEEWLRIMSEVGWVVRRDLCHIFLTTNLQDTGPAPPIKPRLMNLPPSLRDSNVITWSDDPKKVFIIT